MQNMLFKLISTLLFISAVHASEMAIDMDQAYSAEELSTLVRIMKNENKTVFLSDSWGVRTTRNLQRCCKSPLTFLELGFCSDTVTQQDKINDRVRRQEALLSYILDQELTLNQKNIFELVEESKGVQLRNAFEKLQREQIGWYMVERDLEGSGSAAEEGLAYCCCSCALIGVFTALGSPTCSLLTPFCVGATSLFLHASARQ